MSTARHEVAIVGYGPTGIAQGRREAWRGTGVRRARVDGEGDPAVGPTAALVDRAWSDAASFDAVGARRSSGG